MGELDLGLQIALLGLGLGVVIGAVAQKTNFCTMGAISDAVFMEDFSRVRSWLLAIVVALLGTQALHYSGMVDIYQSIYLGTGFTWLSYIVGGLLFGYGMTMTGGCGNKTLVRVGAGNLKSLVVLLVMGATAYMTLRGIIGVGRVQLEDLHRVQLDTPQGIPDHLAVLTGVSVETLRLLVTSVAALLLLVYIFKDAEFRRSGKLIFGGLIIGAAIPAALYITGVVGFDDFEPMPVEAVSFVAPSGQGLQYLMTFTGSSINFGISLAAGVALGSFLAAILTGEFSVETYSDGSEMKRHLLGAAFMGTGGVMALGCTFGQGISGVSTLAMGSFIAIASIVFGAVWGLKSLEHDSVLGGLKAIFTRE